MTRPVVDAERIALLMEGIGSRAKGPGRVYLELRDDTDAN